MYESGRLRLAVLASSFFDRLGMRSPMVVVSTGQSSWAAGSSLALALACSTLLMMSLMGFRR